MRINMSKELEGRIALVTGASRGIGRGIAQELARNGATVIVNYNGSAEAADQVVEQILAEGGRAESFCCNVADYAACESMTKWILEKYGRVDILVNNAGITRDNLLMRMTEAEYDQVLDINLKGAFHTMKHLSRNFLKLKGGRIINISSVSGVAGNAGQANYSASKAGLIGMTKSVAKELGSRGVCVNAIAPGFIRTDMTDALSDKVKEEANKLIPMGHMGEVQDIANLAAFLASDKASYITGQVICVDGGMAM